jgi:Domain of unknown function (DUF4440)
MINSSSSAWSSPSFFFEPISRLSCCPGDFTHNRSTGRRKARETAGGWYQGKKTGTPVEARIARGFQSVHPDGIRDRAGEIALLKKINHGNFTLNNFKSTTIGDNIVVTFTMTVAETIDGKRLPAKPAYRLSVWKKRINGWQWISHANFTPIRRSLGSIR